MQVTTGPLESRADERHLHLGCRCTRTVGVCAAISAANEVARTLGPRPTSATRSSPWSKRAFGTVQRREALSYGDVRRARERHRPGPRIPRRPASPESLRRARPSDRLHRLWAGAGTLTYRYSGTAAIRTGRALLVDSPRNEGDVPIRAGLGHRQDSRVRLSEQPTRRARRSPTRACSARSQQRARSWHRSRRRRSAGPPASRARRSRRTQGAGRRTRRRCRSSGVDATQTGESARRSGAQGKPLTSSRRPT